MKNDLIRILKTVLKQIGEENGIDFSNKNVSIQENKEKSHGDYASNLAMAVAIHLSQTPREVAEKICSLLPSEEWIEKVNIAGPGFINFYLKKDTHNEILLLIEESGRDFGRNNSGNGERVLIEYVSSNPTGPLHVGHGRGAAFGSVLSELLRCAGYKVDEEYYVNDHGRQMNILTISIWLRYLHQNGQELKFSKKGYQGVYVEQLAKQLAEEKGTKYNLKENESDLLELLEAQETEEDLDRLIGWGKSFLKENFEEIREFSLREIMSSIKEDLKLFGVNHNLWFNESSMYSNKIDLPDIDKSIKLLSESGFLYEKEEALWFKSTEFGDDKDRVVKRANSDNTYFASDISYHLDKYDRGYDRIINVWGADHHGYLPRVSAAMEALGKSRDKLEVVFIQFANLIRNGEKVSMSTRGGEFISLVELIEEVSSEAARFFYINRKADQHLDFDLDLAKSQTKENPLYYIQYAHARICGVFETLKKEGMKLNQELGLDNLNLLNLDKEIEIQKMLLQYPEVISRAAENSEPHLLCYYLKDLSGLFHSYYNSERFLVDDEKLMNSRLFLLKGTKQVISNGLEILGIGAPESM
ncbi:MAG: arginine--tRNA ligase [SAR86 cluster bacterium]|nr:arginine--tRNA ligase [SAR86 cluster bacterium]